LDFQLIPPDFCLFPIHVISFLLSYVDSESKHGPAALYDSDQDSDDR
jgi:hypothetical protein